MIGVGGPGPWEKGERREGGGDVRGQVVLSGIRKRADQSMRNKNRTPPWCLF